jgi:photosynthetic reaction center cytochrome c subunit
MVRAINKDHLGPIASLLPANRMGPQGDGPKVGCETCHKGSYKPLFGVSMLGDFPELGGVLVRDATGAGKPAN